MPFQPDPDPQYYVQLYMDHREIRLLSTIKWGVLAGVMKVMGGDLQAAVDLIFSGWLGDDLSMQ